MHIGEFVKKMTFYDFDVLEYEDEKNWFLVTVECAIRFVKELNDLAPIGTAIRKTVLANKGKIVSKIESWRGEAK